MITPRFLPGFTATVDFYQLFTRNVILTSADFSALVLTQNGNFLLNNGVCRPKRHRSVRLSMRLTATPTAPTRVSAMRARLRRFVLKAPTRRTPVSVW